MEKHDEVNEDVLVENKDDAVLDEQKEMIGKQVLETKEKMKRDYYIGIGVLIVAALIVSIFTFSTMHSKGSRLVARMVDSFRNDFGYLVQPFKRYEMSTDIGDNFTGRGSFEMNIHSDIFDSLEPSDEYQVVLDLMDTINQLKFDYSLQTDSKSAQRFQMQFNSMLGDEKLMGFFVSVMNSDGYMLLEGLYDRYLKFSVDEDMDVSQLNGDVSEEDFDYLLDVTLDSLFHRLKEEYFERKTTTITLNGKNKKVNQVSLVMNDDHFGSLMDDLVSDLKRDLKVVSIFKKLGYSFDQYVTPTLDGEEFEIRMYETKFTHQLVRYEFVYDNMSVSYTANKEDTFEIFENDNMVMRAVVMPQDQGYDIALTQWDETDLGQLSVCRNDDELSLEMEIDYNQIRMNMDFSSFMGEKDQKYSDVTQLHMDFSVAGIQIVSFDMNGDSSLEKGASMKDIDVSNSILIDDLTEADYEQIGVKFIDIMERLFGTDLSVLD